MIAVVPRVNEASVDVEGAGTTGAIQLGLCVLLGVVKGDTDVEAEWMAGKLARLRIFADDSGRFNRSVQDVSGSVLLVSQFTLAGDCSRGNRPSFIEAAPPEEAAPLYEDVARRLRSDHGLTVETGVFQSMMTVRIENQGPATIILNSQGT
jgi:D-tyrosyl-tRNA(Tyr) deacylase